MIKITIHINNNNNNNDNIKHGINSNHSANSIQEKGKKCLTTTDEKAASVYEKDDKEFGVRAANKSDGQT